MEDNALGLSSTIEILDVQGHQRAQNRSAECARSGNAPRDIKIQGYVHILGSLT